MFPRSIYQPATLPKLNFLHPYDLRWQLAEFWRRILWRGRQKCEENDDCFLWYRIFLARVVLEVYFHKSTRPRLSKSSDVESMWLTAHCRRWKIDMSWQRDSYTLSRQLQEIIQCSTSQRTLELYGLLSRAFVNQLYSGSKRKLPEKINWHRWLCKTMQIRKFAIQFEWVDCRRT